MPRWIRLYEKKRGARTTGSKVIGVLGEALFFAFLFLLGATCLAVLLVSLWLSTWPANEYFPETYYRQATCRVISKDLVESTVGGRTLYQARLGLRYQAQGKVYESVAETRPGRNREGQQAILNGYEDDIGYTCWYDPENPSRVVVQRHGFWALWLTGFVLVCCVLIGGVGVVYSLLHVGTSAERRAAITRRATDIVMVKEALPSAREFPSVPGDADLTDSPGITLAYRLPIDHSPAWRLLAAALFCLAWNGVFIGLVVWTIGSYIEGQPQWLLTLFMLPFATIGVWSVYYVIRIVLMLTGIGSTTLEISAHPLYPGGKCELLLTQSGRIAVDSLKLLLICEEEATYRQGTNVRTEVQRVVQREVFVKNEFIIKSEKPFEQPISLEMPRECMHTFQSDHNAIRWKLLVVGEVVGWPTFTRAFPIVVYPQAVTREPVATPGGQG